jgi:hypothetical protein
MDETPNIIMQCPKCRKEFPLSANYCEDCTAMLEPTERVQTTLVQSIEAASETPVEAYVPSDEQIENIRIDILKTGLEKSFVSALLYELERLRERMKKKEAVLSDLHKQQTDTSSPDLIPKISRTETEVNEALKRTAKIEAILENLKMKLEADIYGLNTQIRKSEQPGLFGFLSVSGRYFNMLTSELKIKKTLLTAIDTKAYSNRKGMLKYAFFFVMFLIIAGIMTYSLTTVSRKKSDSPPLTTPQKTVALTAIQPKDIYDLLEDIRTANLKKDLSLWESRYAKQYLDDGKKKDEAAKKWKKFEYVSLQYKVQDIQMLPKGITAIISWEMELRSIESGKVTRTTQKLLSEFIVEDSKLKIASVRKAGP